MVRPLTERIERPSADTTPVVTVDFESQRIADRNHQLAAAQVLRVAERGKVQSRDASARSSARSVSGSTPSTRASVTPPSPSLILICFDDPTTWLLVSTSPSGEMTIPDPRPPRSRELDWLAMVSTRTTAGPTRSVTPITALE